MPEITPGPPAEMRSHRAAAPRRWTPRHFGDELLDRHEARRKEKQEKRDKRKNQAAAPAADVPAEADEPAPRGNERTTCACGRRVPAYALVDVRAVDPAVRGAQEWACDGCWTAWIRAEKITRPGWLRALGAPAELVRVHEAHGRPFQP